MTSVGSSSSSAPEATTAAGQIDTRAHARMALGSDGMARDPAVAAALQADHRRGSGSAGVAPVLLRTLLQEAARQGVGPATLCHGLGYTSADLETPGAMVTRAEALSLVRRALQAIGQPTLGLDLGRRGNFADRGALALGLIASATLGEALSLLLRHAASAGLLVTVHELQTQREHLLVLQRMDPEEADVEPFLVDEFFASAVHLARLGTGSACSPLALQLARPRPLHAAAYESHFSCTVRFDGADNRLVLDRSLLATPLPTASRVAYRLACQLLDAEAGRSLGSTIVWATTRLLSRSLQEPPAPQQVAQLLYLSERTLRRRLTEAGTSYRGLLDELRKSRAIELVLEGELALGLIAAEAGFTDASNFRRAFVRWTGRTPSQMRRSGTR